MRIVVAMDSFKGSLTSVEANRAVCRALAGNDVIEVPISDGGEGFLDAWLLTHPYAETITQDVMSLDGTMRQAAPLLTDAVSRAYRLLDKDA
ncbi:MULTISPECIES: glycerate kinase [Exiguobacterium]|uniref:glycerate kinase n=1 Tax=Exiguobacterium TaxID=33986 RepID=UPI002034BBF2|nr:MULTISPECIES: glycerate kinase [Exiguobacterium]MCT4778326.1 glycerate kinase [Exiguobacterium aquaticum]MCT4788014.1 glycerate kinase [Exiguobacterium mexicanum]